MSLLLDLLLPTKCLFCDRLSSRVCHDCEKSIGVEPRLVFRNGFLGFATMPYNDTAQKLLRSYKELGESELARVMASAMTPLLSCFDRLPEYLVPMPSNRTSVRDRGFNPAELLARELSINLPPLTWSNILSRSRETQDQSKLNPEQRAENQRASMVGRVGSGSVVLVDDVVTTGASLIEAKETLENSGYFVQGFVTFAETEAKRCTLTTQAKLPADGGTSWN